MSRTRLLAGISAKEDHFDAVLQDPCFFEDGGERRSRPSRVADAAGEPGEAVIAGAFQGEDNLLPWPGLESARVKRQRRCDEAADLQFPVLGVDDRAVVMGRY